LATDQSSVLDAAAQALLAQFLGMGISLAKPAQNDSGAAAAPDLALPGGTSLLNDTPGLSGAEQPRALLSTALPGGAVAGAQDSVATVTLPVGANLVPLQELKSPQAGIDAGVVTGAADATARLHGLTAADAAALGVAAQADGAPISSGSSLRAGQSAVRLALANAQGLVKWQQTQAEQTAVQTTVPGASARDVFADPALQPATRAAENASLPGLVTSLGGTDAQALRERAREGRGAGASRFEPTILSGGAPAMASPVATSPTAAAAPLAASLAEQVKYWMTNDIRNAELKLDGLGAEPVQVSITMSGNEAQVVFRSDQAPTRELLGNAMGQLEQLLRGEGLLLAGAWVGASGQQAGSGTDAQHGQAGSTANPQISARDATPSASTATGQRVVPTERVLDLFA
jgi:flagellar hook-length control protein FliK